MHFLNILYGRWFQQHILANSYFLIFFLNWQFLSMIGLRDFQILSAKIPDIFKMWHGIQLMVFETPVLWVALL